MSTHCEYMKTKPLVDIGVVADELKLSIPTVTVAWITWFASA